ncbi:MAG: XRE family transcriptional regulator [Dethiosulfatibacter sp.]|nr:XRE family transcriptional regulator [Dethiosulfatibacter sp.]
MLGTKIREIRKNNGMTLNELAEETKFTASYLSQVERELIEPSLSALRKISNVFGVAVYYFLADEEKSHILVKSNERKRLDLPNSSIVYEFITPIADKSLETKMDIIYFEMEPVSWSSEEFLIHNSDECVLVLEGTIEVHIEEQKYTLNEGDSLYIRENSYHKIFNPKEEKATGISTICPALY